jgi:hypothetical protein
MDSSALFLISFPIKEWSSVPLSNVTSYDHVLNENDKICQLSRDEGFKT